MGEMAGNGIQRQGELCKTRILEVGGGKYGNR